MQPCIHFFGTSLEIASRNAACWRFNCSISSSCSKISSTSLCCKPFIPALSPPLPSPSSLIHFKFSTYSFAATSSPKRVPNSFHRAFLWLFSSRIWRRISRAASIFSFSWMAWFFAFMDLVIQSWREGRLTCLALGSLYWRISLSSGWFVSRDSRLALALPFADFGLLSALPFILITQFV